MNKYHVTYYYLATGMEGNADTADLGYVLANSEQEAIEIAGKRRHPKADKLTQTWGLSAKRVYEYIFVPPGSGMSYDYSQSYSYTPETPDDLAFIDRYIEKNMNTALRTQADALSAIRSKEFVIASVSVSGDFSMSESPVTHDTVMEARVEAKRLARLSPGKAFVILQLAGAEMVPTNSISI
jgi:hypothetical protein